MMCIGARVTLRPAHNWLSRFAPLARTQRVGTVVSLPDDRRAEVAFDVGRPGARQVVSTFLRADLLPSIKSPPCDQIDLLATAPAPKGDAP